MKSYRLWILLMSILLLGNCVTLTPPQSDAPPVQLSPDIRGVSPLPLPEETTTLPSTALLHRPLGYQWVEREINRAILQEGRFVWLREGILECVNPPDRQVLWRYAPPEGSSIADIVVAEDRVFALIYRQVDSSTRRIGVIALELENGTRLWEHIFPLVQTSFTVYYSLYASDQTVYVYDGAISLLTALDSRKGEIRWQYSGECPGPALAVKGALWAKCGEDLIELDEWTGEVRARLPDSNAEQIAYKDGFLIIARSIWPDPITHHSQLPDTSLSVWKGQYEHPLWNITSPGPLSGLWLDDETLAFRTGKIVYRVNLRDGTTVWENRLPDERGTNLLKVGRVLLAGSNAGYLHALDWESGRRLWSSDLWTSLKPGSLHVTVLGALEEAIFVRIAWDVAKLTPGGHTPWPTPSPTPVHMPEIFEWKAPPVSKPPEGWVPPSLADVPRRSPEEMAEAHIQILTNFINIYGVEEGARKYAAWALPGLEFEKAVRIYLADLDDDGAQEMIVGFIHPDFGPYCGYGACPYVVIIYERARDLFAPTYALGLNTAHTLDNFSLVLAEDINRDGRTEIVLRSDYCGAHTCFTELEIGQWDGRRWLRVGKMSQSYTQFRVEDRDGDGIKEIIMHGGTIGSAGAGMQRRRTEVYAWKDGYYRKIEDIPDYEPENIYYLMLDANWALARKDLEKALQLAMQVLSRPEARPGNGWGFDEWERVRIVSYAAIEAMLVHAMRGEAEAIEPLLRHVEENYDRLNNPYVEAARRLWEVYMNTRDPILACEEVERVVRENQSEASFLKWPGYATEILSVQNICPLDGNP